MIAKRDEQLFVLQFLSVTVSAIVKLYTSLSVSPYSFCVLKILLQILSWSKKKLVKKKNAAHFWPLSPLSTCGMGLSMGGAMLKCGGGHGPPKILKFF